MAFLEIKNLSFSYPVEEGMTDRLALDSVDLTINDGEFILICGASGCGKSTLLRHLKPSLRPHGKLSGEVLMNDRPVDDADFKTQSRDIGFVMQDPEMQLVTDKVWHELAFGLENLGTDNRTMHVRIAEIASYFGIQSMLESPVCELSGGQKQLICLASVMVMQPKLILLDEPTSQLDPIAASEFFNTLKRINEELGTTIIITEHRYETLFPLVDRVAFMQGGRVVSVSAPKDTLKSLKTQNDFLQVLPTSMRIYATTATHESLLDNAPLTVREGREYLASLISNAVLTESKRLLKSSKAAVEPLISAREIWFRYERDSQDILKGMSLDIYPNELTCILGGNGAGKTTALMTASGLYRPYRGNIRYHGKSIFAYGKTELYGKRIGVLVQNPQCCFVKDSVREELEAVCRSFNLGKGRLEEVVSVMEIEPILGRHPYDVSGGELQRAAIAKLLLPNPEVLFLDEATKGMDAFFKARFGRLLRRLTKSGVSIVLVSHDIEFCAEFADKCAMFFNGSVTAQGTPGEVLLDNSFYTTAANRLSRGITASCLTADDIIEVIKAKV